MAHPPKNLQGTLWSSNVNQLDLQKNKAYIIHQVITYGTMDQLKWLFQTYPKREIVDTFVHQPIKMYSRQMFAFIKNFVLPLRDVELSETKYVSYVIKRTPGKFGRPPIAVRVS